MWQEKYASAVSIWEWEGIFGRAVKAISSLGVRSSWDTIDGCNSNNQYICVLCRYYLDSITLIETIVISSLCLFWSIHVKCQGHNHAGLCALHCRQYCCNQTTQARHSSWHTRKNSTIQLSFEFFIHLLPTIIAIKYWAIVDELIQSFFCQDLPTLFYHSLKFR